MSIQTIQYLHFSPVTHIWEMAGLLLLPGLAVLLCIALTYKHRHQVKPRSITTEHGLYKDVLPPSRRQATGFKEVPRREILQSLVPLEGDVTHLHGTYTPTGISSNDIRRLGRFPDYAMLSGVRLPEPLPHVDINTACARPYRPVRWPYHQTMCMMFTSYQLLCTNSQRQQPLARWILTTGSN